MPCATIITAAVGGLTDADAFGIKFDENGLVTQSISVQNTKTKTEVRDKCGDVINVAFTNEKSEVTFEGYGAGTAIANIGASISLANAAPFDDQLVNATVYIKSVDVSRVNSDFIKTSVKGTAYKNIPSAV